MDKHRYSTLVLFSLMTALFIALIFRLMPLSVRGGGVSDTEGKKTYASSADTVLEPGTTAGGGQSLPSAGTENGQNSQGGAGDAQTHETSSTAEPPGGQEEESGDDNGFGGPDSDGDLTADQIADKEQHSDNYYVTEFDGMDKYIIPQEDSSATGEENAPSTGGGDPFFSTEFDDTLPLSYGELKFPEASEKEDINAVWVASVYNLNYPSRPGLPESELAAELDAIVENTVAAGLNTIFFQVRPCADALYDSDIFPRSEFLGEGDFDPLEYIVDRAHENGVSVHAWINPYRITVFSASSAIAEKYPELVMKVDGKLYFDPSKEDAMTLIIRGVAEIVVKYDVDGIVFDDYFYPEGITDEDKGSYDAYILSGGKAPLGDWRRENVNALIRKTYAAIKQLRGDCLFGVSPRGIWRNSSTDANGSATGGSQAYDDVYCDALAWIEDGCIDYISPQIYWSFDNKTAPFAVLCDWWNDRLNGKDIMLVVSLAAYYLPESEIESQKEYLSELGNYGGFAIYSYASLT